MSDTRSYRGKFWYKHYIVPILHISDDLHAKKMNIQVSDCLMYQWEASNYTSHKAKHISFELLSGTSNKQIKVSENNLLFFIIGIFILIRIKNKQYFFKCKVPCPFRM